MAMRIGIANARMSIIWLLKDISVLLDEMFCELLSGIPDPDEYKFVWLKYQRVLTFPEQREDQHLLPKDGLQKNGERYVDLLFW